MSSYELIECQDLSEVSNHASVAVTSVEVIAAFFHFDIPGTPSVVQHVFSEYKTHTSNQTSLKHIFKRCTNQA